MSSIPWYGWIAILAVAVWALIAAVGLITSRSRKSDAEQLQAALDANTAANREVAEHLGAIDRRLAAVEKTLTDIG